MDRAIRNNIEINPAEKGEIGSSVEKPKSFNASEATQESDGFTVSKTDESLNAFMDSFQKCILDKDVEGIFAFFTTNLKNEAGDFEEFQKFYNNSEVISNIVTMSFELKKYDDTHAEYSGTVTTELKKEHPAIIKVQKENVAWKISEIDFSPVQ